MNHQKSKTAKSAFALCLGVALLLALALFSGARASALSCNNCVNGGDIVNGQIRSADIGNYSIATNDIASNSITSAKIATDAVGEDEITSNAVGSDELADDIIIPGYFTIGAQSYVVDDNGGGTAATDTLTPNGSYIEADCLDADGCNVTIGETSAIEGDTLYILNTGSNTINFADSSGVSELAGAFAAGHNDTLTMMYDGDAYVEFSRSNN